MNDVSEQEDPSATTPSLLNDWIDVVFHHLPGAARAASRLIGSVGDAGSAFADIGKAKGEQLSKRIRGRTDAEASILAAVVDGAIAHARTDPGLSQRAIDYFLKDIIAKQDNREQVVHMALSDLRGEKRKSLNPK